MKNSMHMPLLEKFGYKIEKKMEGCVRSNKIYLHVSESNIGE